MKNNVYLSAAVVTYNDGEKAEKICNQLLELTKGYRLKLYVFDNSPNDSVSRLLSNKDGIVLIKNTKNIGFGAAHNKAVEMGLGKYHFVINPDIEIENDILSSVVDFMEQNPDISMLMPKILNPDRSEQKLPKERPTFKRLFLGRLASYSKAFEKIRADYIWAHKELTKVTDINFCSGCFFCIRGEIFKELGGFDERYFMYLEDADLALSVKKKGRVVIAPQFSVIHQWNRTSNKSLKYLIIHIISSIKFLLKWR